MTLSYKSANLMEFSEDAFGHGCNCQKRMASGVAYAVRSTFFEMVEADTNDDREPKDRLGEMIKVPLSNGKVGYNIYSQFMYGRDTRKVDYDALRRGVTSVCQDLIKDGKTSLALPKIGCGLAGGDWSVVSEILEDVSKDTGIEITIYEYEPPKYV